MNKNEFITAMADRAGLTKKDTTAALAAFIDVTTETLSAKGEINLVGFMKLSTAERAARTAKVPGTNTEVQVPATTAVKVKIGKSLKDTIAGK